MTGIVVAIYITPAAKAPMESVASAELVGGHGVQGDRYSSLAGTFSEEALRPDQEVTLIESEEIDAFNEDTGLAVDYGAVRRNVVTRGVRLNDLVGRQFRVGQALLEGMRLCEPCTHLASLVSAEVLSGLVQRGGLRARILEGGRIRVSDPVDGV
jgi:MOSC domain